MKAVVTGGGGFVGGALCRRLRALGHDVTAVGRRPAPALAAAGIATVVHDLAADAAADAAAGDAAGDGAGGVIGGVIGGVTDRLAGIFAGSDCVFHTAAHVKMWGPHEAFVRGNITATARVIAACRAAGVGRLVFTSSPSVVAADHDLRGVDESLPYPSRYRASYPETKAAAERAVLATHGAGLRTISLRPHLIFGPGDTNLVPTILGRARAGRLVQVGDGRNVVDLTFIEDCVAAHLLAAEAIAADPAVGGRAYFISQGAPVPLWEWIGRVLALHGLPPVRRRIPLAVARVAAAAAEGAWRGLRLAGDPPLTRFLAEEMATDHYFDIGAARCRLGYEPSCTVWEATDRSFGAAVGRPSW